MRKGKAVSIFSTKTLLANLFHLFMLAVLMVILKPAHSYPNSYGVSSDVIIIGSRNIYLGPSPAIDMRSLMGSTWISLNANFLAEKYAYIRPYPLEKCMVLEQRLALASEYGLAALVGSRLDNNGLISIEYNGSESDPMIRFYDNQLINFTLPQHHSIVSVNTNGEPLENAPSNNGRILVTAHTIRTVLDNIVNMQGIDQARTAVQQHGKIILMALKNKAKSFHKTRSPQSSTKSRNKMPLTERALNKAKKLINARYEMSKKMGTNIFLSSSYFLIGANNFTLTGNNIISASNMHKTKSHFV